MVSIGKLSGFSSSSFFLISGSPRYDNIMNVSNQPITNVLSNYDYNYLDNMGLIKDILKSDKYHETRCKKNIISASLSDFMLYPIKEFFLMGNQKKSIQMKYTLGQI